MAKAPKARKSSERTAEQTIDPDRRNREAPKDMWDIKADADVDTRAIITDWASI